ncbi:mechanosensitive ion channel family protein [Rubrivivax albus]|uniref:Mechanosensitive ion channel family protein n=1 Tax=Rubrivivax albus TaxID=2499835 RepID=A0A437JUX3_9BURK|nr:mechanosensitive ion channel domain-containing protein [Rubrivivax albus]RVT51031.1 mechanosensitive ion channel family protein [Rubrivivax albus]
MPDLDPLLSSLVAWGPPLASAAVAAVLASLVFALGARLVGRATAGLPAAAAVARAIRAPARLLLPLLAVVVVWHGTADDLAGRTMVLRLTTMAWIAALTWLLVRAVGGYGQAVIDAHPVSVADNLQARRVHTQTRVLVRTVGSVLWLAGVALMLMTIPGVRQVGASLLASAGVIGLIAGFAARPVLGNMIAGLQIGLTQPIRIDDVVIVEGEWGVIEEIGSAYVVVRIWDDRRLVVPLQYWVEKPFQNWTRKSAQLTGSVTLWVDYRMPLAPLREHLRLACEACEHWDGRLALLQVVEAGERAMQVRALVTAADAGKAWDLRCHVREWLVDYVQREFPAYLPRLRVDTEADGAEAKPAVKPPRDTS